MFCHQVETKLIENKICTEERTAEGEKHMFTPVLKDNKALFIQVTAKEVLITQGFMPEDTQVITVRESLVLSVYLYICKNPDIGLPTVPHSLRLALFLCFLISSCPI